MKIRVIRVPECGYLVLGPGTYSVGAEVDVSDPSIFDPEEIAHFLDTFIEEVPQLEHPNKDDRPGSNTG